MVVLESVVVRMHSTHPSSTPRFVVRPSRLPGQAGRLHHKLFLDGGIAKKAFERKQKDRPVFADTKTGTVPWIDCYSRAA